MNTLLKAVTDDFSAAAYFLYKSSVYICYLS